MTRDQVFEFFRRLAEENPSPTTELLSSNPYQLLVAVVLSAQATDASVNIATRPLFEHVKTPQQMVDLGEERLREAIKTIGLFNTKAKNVIALSQVLIDQYGSKVRAAAKSWKLCPESGARRRTWCSTPRSARRRSRSTRTSSESATALASHQARTRLRWS